jgi:hypothetical protein
MKAHFERIAISMIIFSVIFSPGCFFLGAQGGASRGIEIFPASTPQPEQGSYTPLQRIRVVWRSPSVEGVTRQELWRERQRGYTAAMACQQWHRSSIDLVLFRQVGVIRGADAVVGVRYSGRYRGGYPHRQLECWAEGMAVHMGASPMPHPSGGLRIIVRDHGRRVIDTRY